MDIANALPIAQAAAGDVAAAVVAQLLIVSGRAAVGSLERARRHLNSDGLGPVHLRKSYNPI